METVEGRTVLVTGAGGFIGPRVVKTLLNGGARVRALIGPAGRPGKLLDSPSLENVTAEISDVAAVERITKGVQIVVHMAGPPSVACSFDHPTAFAQTHVAGTATILNSCRKAGIRRFVYISSAEIYGRPRSAVVTENHPVAPRSPYGAAKVGAELFVRVFAMNFGISSVILRPFSVYGAGAPSHGVVRTILRMAQFEDMVVLRDLAPVRDYCFVDDVADAIARACTAPVDCIATINIGSGIGISVGDLAQTVLRVLGRSIPIREDRKIDRPANAEIYNLVADCSLAAELLSWHAKTDLETGIRRSL
jgi:nucleoside-diphosphate-sugar epimerase